MYQDSLSQRTIAIVLRQSEDSQPLDQDPKPKRVVTPLASTKPSKRLRGALTLLVLCAVVGKVALWVILGEARYQQFRIRLEASNTAETVIAMGFMPSPLTMQLAEALQMDCAIPDPDFTAEVNRNLMIEPAAPQSSIDAQSQDVSGFRMGT